MRYIVIVFLFFISCTEKKQVHPSLQNTNCDSARYSYRVDILPILSANCNFGACHSRAANPDYDFTIYDNIARQAGNGNIEDRLMLPIEDPKHMPVGFKLSACDYYKILTWVYQGYPEN